MRGRGARERCTAAGRIEARTSGGHGDECCGTVVGRHLEVAAPCCIDVCNRITALEDAPTPREYDEAIERQGELGVLPSDFARELASPAGLRNGTRTRISGRRKRSVRPSSPPRRPEADCPVRAGRAAGAKSLRRIAPRPLSGRPRWPPQTASDRRSRRRDEIVVGREIFPRSGPSPIDKAPRGGLSYPVDRPASLPRPTPPVPCRPSISS